MGVANVLSRLGRGLSRYGAAPVNPATPPFLPSGEYDPEYNATGIAPSPVKRLDEPAPEPEPFVTTREKPIPDGKPPSAASLGPPPVKRLDARDEAMEIGPEPVPPKTSWKRQLAAGLLRMTPVVNLTDIPEEVAAPGYLQKYREHKAKVGDVTRRAELEDKREGRELTREQRDISRRTNTRLEESDRRREQREETELQAKIAKEMRDRGAIPYSPERLIGTEKTHEVENDALGNKWIVPTREEYLRQTAEGKGGELVDVPTELQELLGPKATRDQIVRAQNATKQKQDDAYWLNKSVDPKATPQEKAQAEAYLRRKASLAQSMKITVAAPGATANDPNDIAQAIIDGDQPPDMKGLYRLGGPVRAALARKGYDLTAAQRDWYAVQRTISGLNSPQQLRIRQALETLDSTLPLVEQAYKRWKQAGVQSGVRVFNKASLAASSNLPGETGAAARQLMVYVNDVVPETGYVYMGGNSPTDHALRLAANNLSADWNEQQFMESIGVLRKNLQIRRNSILTSAPVGGTVVNQYWDGGGQNQQSPVPAQDSMRREQFSRSTGQYRHTLDGGKTWQPGRLPK